MRMHQSPPQIVNGYVHDDLGQFFVIVPEASVNYIQNPAFEHVEFDKGYMGGTGGGAIQMTRKVGRVRRWYACTQVDGPPDSWIGTVVNTSLGPPWTFSLDIKTLALPCVVSLELWEVSSGFANLQNIIIKKEFKEFKAANEWYRIYVTHSKKTDSISYTEFMCMLRLVNGQSVHTDGWQLEEKAYPTTYFDGEYDILKHPGYGENLQWWESEPHFSTSHRSQHDRAGGRQLRFSDLSPLISTKVDTAGSYCEKPGIQITGYSGLDAPTVQHQLTTYLGDGSHLLGTTAPQRNVSLRGRISAQSPNMYNAIRGALTRIFASDSTIPQQAVSIIYRPFGCHEPSILEYEQDVEIRCLYESGLEGNRQSLYQEDVELKFVCPDPRLFQIHSTSFQLATNQGVAEQQVVNCVLRRLSERQLANAQLHKHYDYKLSWDNIGKGPSYPDKFTEEILASGYMSCVTVAPFGEAFFGGTFTAKTASPGNNLIRFVPDNSSLHGGTWYGYDLPDRVRAIEFDLNYRMWVGGDFGLAYIDYGSTTPNYIGAITGTVYSLKLNRNGNILVGGPMPTHDYLVEVDINSNPVAVSTFYGGTDGPIHNIAIGLDGSVYIVGSFLNAGGQPAGKVARLRNGVWEDLNPTPDAGTILVLDVDRHGYVYAGGGFEMIGGINSKGIAKFNGMKWEPLGAGLKNVSGIDGGQPPVVHGIQTRANGEVWAAGQRFDYADNIPLSDSIAVWTGSSWLPADVRLSMGFNGGIFKIDESQNGDLYFAGSFWGHYGAPTKSSFNYWGKARTYPEIKYAGAGLYHMIGNYTTEKFMYLDLAIRTPDQTTLIHASPNLAPRVVTRESNSRVQRDMSHTILSASDWVISLEPNDKPFSRQVEPDQTVGVKTLDNVVPSNVLGSFKSGAGVPNILSTNGIHTRFRVAHWGVGDVEGVRF